VKLWRVLPFDEMASPDAAGGALWFPREQQGDGRHDNPELYGCLYAAEDPVSAVAEQLSPFRGTGDLLPSMLVRLGRPLVLAGIEVAGAERIVDLDDPLTLREEGLRPSQVATRRRSATQIQAAEIHAAHADAIALRWWSTLEASWINWTVFDHAAPSLELAELARLDLEAPVVHEAAQFLGLAPV
jgi:RES domain